MFNNITVFILGCYGGYVKCDYPKLTKSQFEKKMARQRCACVVPVDAQPSQILALEDCADAAVDIDDVQLHDGMRLAVVASRGAALVGCAENASNKLEKTVGWFTLHTHTTGMSIYFVIVEHVCTLRDFPCWGPGLRLPAVRAERA